MYATEYTNKFKQDLKRCKKRGLDIELIKKVIKELETKGTLPPIYKPHILSGIYAGIWECHIKPE